MPDNIYEINGTSYRVKIHYYQDGKKATMSKSFSFHKYGGKTNALKQAKAYRDSIRNKYNTDGYLLPSVITLEDVMNLKRSLFPMAADTEKKHDLYYNKYILPISKPFDQVTAADIQICLNSLVTECSDNTIQRVYTVWKYLYKAAQLAELNITDKTISVQIPKSKQPKHPRLLEFDPNLLADLLTTLEASDIHDHYLISLSLKVMYVLGLRPGEAFALNSNDIDIVGRYVDINKACTNKGKLTHTKNANSIRRIPYPAKFDFIFEELKSINGQVFRRSNGELLGSNYVSTVLKRLSGGKFRSYMLRHRLSTELVVNKNSDPRSVQQIMGHKNISQTIAYAVPQEDKLRSILEDNTLFS